FGISRRSQWKNGARLVGGAVALALGCGVMSVNPLASSGAVWVTSTEAASRPARLRPIRVMALLPDPRRRREGRAHAGAQRHEVEPGFEGTTGPHDRRRATDVEGANVLTTGGIAGDGPFALPEPQQPEIGGHREPLGARHAH